MADLIEHAEMLLWPEAGTSARADAPRAQVVALLAIATELRELREWLDRLEARREGTDAR